MQSSTTLECACEVRHTSL